MSRVITNPNAICSHEHPVLVVGAGPTGLTAALELARRNVPVRIIERRNGPSPLSRAVGIMPWAMDILDASGAGPLVRSASQPTRRVEIWSGTRRAASLRMDMDPDPRTRLFCLPQNETETILADCLARHGVAVHYGHTLEAIKENGDDVRVRINGATHTVSLVLGADGIRSTVRAHLGQEFRGYDLPSNWSIADVDAPEWSEPGVFRVFLRDDGEAIFVIPIGPTRFRAVASVPDALNAMPVPIPVTHVHRTGDFTIGIRQVDSYGRGRIWLAGDAAHTHSPVGGRGMNLGIEDAAEWVTRLVDCRLNPGRDEGYCASRHVRGREIIDFTEQARQRVTATASLSRNVALMGLRALGSIAPVNRAIARRMLLT